ncbi:hypothetical protein JOD02_000305 [Caldicoprobacter guelmensis]|uniref:hypothetical protein n=1 Tax=Caldicoprobacter guelmensis TaxID=1170224 RepID=UPI00195877AB|nr:hypothetical protein [Caldicoprobacter guelmensis]MBM7581482.1 hypothetical protein [Caldicoprobacter guelmensis]
MSWGKVLLQSRLLIAIGFQPITRGRAKTIQGAEGQSTNGSVQPRGCTGPYRYPVWSNEPSRQVMTCLVMVPNTAGSYCRIMAG